LHKRKHKNKKGQKDAMDEKKEKRFFWLKKIGKKSQRMKKRTRRWRNEGKNARKNK